MLKRFWRWLTGSKTIEERFKRTVLWPCGHPVWETLSAVLVSREESGMRKGLRRYDLLTVNLWNPEWILLPQVCLAVPRRSLEFRLEWSGNELNPNLFLVDERDGERHRLYTPR